MAVRMKPDHCVAHVVDWARSSAFYRDVLGAEIVTRPNGGFAYRFGANGDGTSVDFRNPGGSLLEFISYWKEREAPQAFEQKMELQP
jgi:catechol 2,3-dioxygenase-like lactoylglutathione lyase family enzyme